MKKAVRSSLLAAVSMKEIAMVTMTKSRRALFLIHAIVLFAATAAFGAGTMDAQTAMNTIIERQRQLLLQGDPPDRNKVMKIVAGLQPDGRWPDVDYVSKCGVGWVRLEHLKRVRLLGKALAHPRSPLKNDEKVRAAALLSLDHWLKKPYHSKSGWFEWIGTPREMRDPLVLLKPWLSKKQLDGGVSVMKQCKGMNDRGANLTWKIDIVLFYGALSGDTNFVEKAAKKMAESYNNYDKEGVQPDWSYFQHGPRLQTFAYGYAYIQDASRLAWLVHGTPWGVPEEKLQIFANFILEGAEWMRRGKATIPSTLDRSVSRANELDRPIAGALGRLRDMLPSRKEQIDAGLAREAGSGKPLDGNRYFTYGELMVHHRPKFSFFVKVLSSRTLNTEVRKWNKENLLGDQLSGGDHYIIRHGREYYNMMPVWNWGLLPGVTAARRKSGVNRKAFVGGVSNGHSGCAAMDYDGFLVTGRKAWFCHGDIVVCLIGDLAAWHAGNRPVRTALEQSRLAGNVTVGLKGGKTIQPKEGTHELKDVTWIHHDSIAYIPLAPAPISLTFGEVSGSWEKVNSIGVKKAATDHVFLPVLEHGKIPRGGSVSCGYVLAPGVDAAGAKRIASDLPVEVLENSHARQAVRFTDGTLMVAFYEAGEVKSKGRTIASASLPCLLLSGKAGSWAANPAFGKEPMKVNLALGGSGSMEVMLPARGKSVRCDAKWVSGESTAGSCVRTLKRSAGTMLDLTKICLARLKQRHTTVFRGR